MSASREHAPDVPLAPLHPAPLRTPGWRVFLRALKLRREPMELLRYVTHELPDAFRIHHPYRRVYLMKRPEHVRHVLFTGHRNFRRSRFYDPMKAVLGEGLLTSDGELWRRQRRWMAPAFQQQRIARLTDVMVEEAEGLAVEWRRLDGEPIDVGAAMMRLTLTIAGRTLFHADVRSDAVAVARALPVALHEIETRVNSYTRLAERLPTRRQRAFRRAVADLDAVVLGIIARRREGGEEHDDLLSMLMAARDADTGESMSDRQLRDEVMTLLLAGHETTANLLTWSWLALAEHPEVEAALHAEVDTVLGDRPARFDDYARLSYTRQVLEETMRLYPPAYAMDRAVIDDDTIGEHRIPGGSVVVLSPYMTHRHPEFWSEAERFDPTRFEPARSAERPRGLYFPFGGGPRQCIGNHFAMVESVLVLATLARRLRWRRIDDRPVEAWPSVTLRPRHGLPMRPSGR